MGVPPGGADFDPNLTIYIIAQVVWPLREKNHAKNALCKVIMHKKPRLALLELSNFGLAAERSKCYTQTITGERRT